MKPNKFGPQKGRGAKRTGGIDEERRMALLSGKAFKSSKPKKEKQKNKAPKPKKPQFKIVREHVELSDTFPLDACPAFSREEEGSGLECSDALAQLVSLYLLAARDKSCHIAMCFPVLPRHPVLIHAQACMQRLSAGDKRGVCGVLYPAKSNAFHALNHVAWDGQAITDLASRVAEAGESSSRGCVVRSCPEKDPFLFFLGQIKAEVAIDPALSDLIPTFYSGQDLRPWSEQRSALMGTVSVQMSRRDYKSQFQKSICDAIGHPLTGTDAIFAIDGRMTDEASKGALRALNQRTDPPEVLMVMVSSRERRENPGWSKSTIRFLMRAKESLRDDFGVLVLCDDPCAALDFQESWHAKEILTERPKMIHLHGMISSHDGYGLSYPTDAKPPIDSLTLRLEVIDQQANQLSRKLSRQSKQAGLNESPDNPIRDVIGYLSRISSLPCGVKDLVQYILDGELSESSARLYSYSAISGAVLDGLKNRTIDCDPGEVKVLLGQLTEMVEQYEERTPLALRLARLVEDVARSSKRRVVLAFNSHLRLRLAQIFLARYADFQDGVRFDDFQDRVVFLHVDQLEPRLEELAGEKLILVGASDSGLRIALTSNQISKHTYLLLTMRSAHFLRVQLRTLMDRFVEPFLPMRTRVDSLLKKLNELPISQDILNAVIPKNSIDPPDLRLDLESRSGQCTSQEAWAPGDIVIYAEGRSAIAKAPDAPIFLYDPTSASSTERGFRMVRASELKVGDQWFAMSADLRERLREVLKEYGQSVAPGGNLEGTLRLYHQNVRHLFRAAYKQPTKNARVEALRQDILNRYPHVADGFPKVQAMLNWVDLEHAEQTDFEVLRPQAPQNRDHFFAFVQTLGLSNELSRFMWGLAIKPLRSARRRGGRLISDMYAHVLLEPEYLEVMANIPPRVTSQLFLAAREHVVPINRIWIVSGDKNE